MSRENYQKLIDIPSVEARKREALEAFLWRHDITFRTWGFVGEGRVSYVEYRVRERDLCCAQAVLPAIQDLGAEYPPSPPEAA